MYGKLHIIIVVIPSYLLIWSTVLKNLYNSYCGMWESHWHHWYRISADHLEQKKIATMFLKIMRLKYMRLSSVYRSINLFLPKLHIKCP